MGADNENDKRDYIRIQQLRQQLQTERKEDVISELTKKIEEIDKRLSEHVNSYADFAASKSIKWENVRDALSADDVAIEFYNIPLVFGGGLRSNNGWRTKILRNNTKKRI